MNVVIENVPTCVKALSDAMNCDSGAMNYDSQHGADFMIASEMDYADKKLETRPQSIYD